MKFADTASGIAEKLGVPHNYNCHWGNSFSDKRAIVSGERVHFFCPYEAERRDRHADLPDEFSSPS